jgi:Tfp pilus assembly protein PilP
MKLQYLLAGILLLALSLSQASAQSDIVKWTFEIENADGKNLLKATADIKNEWFMYSQHTDEGPIPTSFEMKQASGELVTVVFQEVTTPIKKYSELFEAEVIKFQDEAIFTYSLEGYKSGDIISGSVTYMSCDKSKCLPPKSVDFEVKI